MNRRHVLCHSGCVSSPWPHRLCRANRRLVLDVSAAQARWDHLGQIFSDFVAHDFDRISVADVFASLLQISSDVRTEHGADSFWKLLPCISSSSFSQTTLQILPRISSRCFASLRETAFPYIGVHTPHRVLGMALFSVLSSPRTHSPSVPSRMPQLAISTVQLQQPPAQHQWQQRSQAAPEDSSAQVVQRHQGEQPQRPKRSVHPQRARDRGISFHSCGRRSTCRHHSICRRRSICGRRGICRRRSACPRRLPALHAIPTPFAAVARHSQRNNATLNASKSNSRNVAAPQSIEPWARPKRFGNWVYC